MNDDLTPYDIPPKYVNILENQRIQYHHKNLAFNYWPNWNMPATSYYTMSDNFTYKERHAAYCEPSAYVNETSRNSPVLRNRRR